MINTISTVGSNVIELAGFRKQKTIISETSTLLNQHNVKDLIAESELLLSLLENVPLNAEIGKRTQMVIKEIINRLGNSKDLNTMATNVDKKLQDLSPFL